MLVGDVVGELQLVEGDHLLHPLLARRRAVWVDVHPLWHLWVGLASNDPPAGTEEFSGVTFSSLSERCCLLVCTMDLSVHPPSLGRSVGGWRHR